MIKPAYKFLEHTADELFVAQAPNLNALFEQCALAVEEVMINLKEVEEKKTIELTGEANNVENLLFDFLDDLIYYKDAEQLIFNKFEVNIMEKKDKFFLQCFAHGEKINPQKHEQKVDIKAITMHMFEVREIEGGFQAQVLVDI